MKSKNTSVSKSKNVVHKKTATQKKKTSSVAQYPPRVSEHRIVTIEGLQQLEQGQTITQFIQNLPSGQRAAVQHFLLGIMRWRGSLDAVISQFVDKKPKPIIMQILRLGAFELHFSQTAEHAALDQCVELCKHFGKTEVSGFVNAVLRKIQTATIDKNPMLNLPMWLQERWKEKTQWVASLQESSRTYLSFANAASKKAYPIELNRCIVDGTEIENMGYAEELVGSVNLWPQYEEGTWSVMNPASALVVDKTWECMGKPVACTVLDMCAAPGGKSIRLHHYGATVLATDSSNSRLQTMVQNCKRLQITMPIQQCDWRIEEPKFGKFQLVLLDAPCTGTGVIRKHPEIKWKRTMEDVLANQIIQMRLLSTAVQYVEEKGYIAYAVCSILEEEGQEVISYFLENHPEFTLEHTWCSITNASGIENASVLQARIDGFQLFVLRKIS